MNKLVKNTVEWMEKKWLNYKLFEYEGEIPPWIRVKCSDGNNYICIDFNFDTIDKLESRPDLDYI